MRNTGVGVRQASHEFQVFAKPVGANCNLACHYCYYLDKQGLYPNLDVCLMTEDVLEEYIRQHIAAASGRTISFSWHGGEPTLAGLEYFQQIVALQQLHRPPGKRITNGMQTNGVLLDVAWCRFLAREGFGVGLSIDGPAEIHDSRRVDRGGGPTHARAMRAYELLRHHGVPCDLLCVVHNGNVRRPREVYRFFREIGARYIGFLPVVEPLPARHGGVSPHTVPASEYGRFLTVIFDEWLRRDTDRIRVQIFEEAARTVRGEEHALCIFRETCGDVPVVEHNGDFYCCDHYVDAEHRLGNITRTPLVDLLESTQQTSFGAAKRNGLPEYCRRCEVLPMCNGGCPKDRFLRTPDGEPGLNYLCAGLRSFFMHSRPYLKQLAHLDTTHPPAVPKVGRNDACPCGSGRKFKKCCLPKQTSIR